MRVRVLLLLAACGGAAPSPPPPPLRPAPIDAGVDAAPDAGIDGQAWVFRYHTAQRTETWTLRWQDDRAQLVVDGTTGTQRYWGTYKDGVIDVATASAKLSLTCKPAQRALSKKCNDKKAAKVDVLECSHKDFAEPMPFGTPGVEYIVDASCTGYRMIESP